MLLYIMNNATIFLIIFIYYIILDGLMIYFYMGKTFSKMVGKIQNGEPMIPKIFPAILAFLVLAFGIYYFIIEKVRDNNILIDSLKYGFVFGFVVYAVYDFTNLATLNNYSIKVTIIDILWGSTLAFLVTVLTKFTIKLFKKKGSQ